jgi:hypothetical protein
MLYLDSLVDSADIHLRSGTRQTNAGLGGTDVLIIPITSSDQLLYGELLSNQRLSIKCWLSTSYRMRRVSPPRIEEVILLYALAILEVPEDKVG